jgi:hypothetical protein
MKKYVVVLMLLSMAVAMPAYGGQYYCTGQVTFLAVHQGGIVEVAGPGNVTYVHVCQLGVTANGWNPDSCKTAYATLLAAKLSGQPVNLIFFDNLTCTTQPAYSDSTESTIMWVGPA